MIDEVEKLGIFAEIERIAPEERAVQAARESVLQLSHELGLRNTEPKSYLTLVLECGDH